MEYEDIKNEIICLEKAKTESDHGSSKRPPSQISPLVLAYIGDTVYDLFVRTRLIGMSDANAHGLHMMAIKHVCAKAQAQAFRRIEPMLFEDELAIYKRGRNSHMGTVPKNAEISDYRAATGFEALLGYLYLSGRMDRLLTLVDESLKTDGDTWQKKPE